MKSTNMKAKYFQKDIVGERADGHPLAELVYPLKLIIIPKEACALPLTRRFPETKLTWPVCSAISGI